MQKQVPASQVSHECDYIFLIRQYCISNHGKHFTAVLNALKKKLYLRHPFPQFSDVRADTRGISALIDSLPIPDAHQRSKEINNALALKRLRSYRRRAIDRGDKFFIEDIKLVNP